MREFSMSDERVRANVPGQGFDLKTASREIRLAASLAGIKSGRWEPVNSSIDVAAMGDNEIVARVWNSRMSAELTAAAVMRAREAL